MSFKHNYLQNVGEFRFLIEENCNYNCPFCHREGIDIFSNNTLSIEDYEFLGKISIEHFDKNTCTLTGGEPLLRKDIHLLSQKLFELGLNITLVSNGFFILENIELGKYIKKFNISLHTTNISNYSSMIGRDNCLNKVLKGLESLRNTYPLIEICLNVVITKNINDTDTEFLELVKFASNINANIKAIQLFPSNCCNFVNIDKIKDILLTNNFSNTQSSNRKQTFFNGYCSVSLTKIFCAHVFDNQSNLINYCTTNNDLFFSSNGCIYLCRENPNLFIDLSVAIATKNTVSTVHLIKEAYLLLGKNCPYEMK